MAKNNYPSGIRGTQNDPRSPLYTEPPHCEDCDSELVPDVDCDLDGYHTIWFCTNPECGDER